MVSWRCQLEGIMDFTRDLIECVNNDTKELMYDSSGSSGHESADTIEEMIEDDDDDDREEEIMQLFLLSAMAGGRSQNKKNKYGGNKSLMKEFMSIYKRNGKIFRHSRKANKEVQTAYAKIKRHESFAKRRVSWEEPKFLDEAEEDEEEDDSISDFHYSEKMFESVMDWPDLFNDWTWNLREAEDEVERIFADWRWNLEGGEDLKKKFYDDPSLETEWNEFNFWRVTDNLRVDQELDTGCLADSEGEERTWRDCLFWQDTTDNWNIIHNLVDGVCVDEDKEFENYWDENVANQSILESLLDDTTYTVDGDDASDLGSDVECNEFIWDMREPLVALISMEENDHLDDNNNEENFLWNEPSVLFSLLDAEDESHTRSHDEVFEWEEPKYLRALLEIEEDMKDIYTDNKEYLWEDPDIVKSLLEDGDLIAFSDDNEDDSWLQWPFWDHIGPRTEIVKAYEVCYSSPPNTNNLLTPNVNIEDVFWDICLEDCPWKRHKDSDKKMKDPVNIFKSIKHIFNVPKQQTKKKRKTKGVVENHLFDDMEDIYGDWAPLALADVRSEKKRQCRGRRTGRNKGRGGTPRTPTPTIQTRQARHQDQDACWVEVETKRPSKERRTAFARNQKRLNAKMFAKQPRKIT